MVYVSISYLYKANITVLCILSTNSPTHLYDVPNNYGIQYFAQCCADILQLCQQCIASLWEGCHLPYHYDILLAVNNNAKN